MKETRNLRTFLFILAFFLCTALQAIAGEPSVEVIDKTNWEKIKGLVPDPLPEWVKEGKFILTLQDLNYDPVEHFMPFAAESRSANVGRFDLSEENEVVDANTGKLAVHLEGFPFPKVDPADPKAAVKVMYNKQYLPYVIGYKRFTTIVSWVGRGGLEREVEALFRDFYFTGFPGANKHSNPKDMERYSIISVRSPYDLAGTSVMLWRYLANKQDVNFSYVPAIRRVRRTTPANRSDGFLGSDFTQDDILAYDGKIPAFEWKLVGKKDVLGNFHSPDPVRMTQTGKGEWLMDQNVDPIRYGFMEESTTLEPWCPTNTVYTRRPAWVIEAKSKDPYYNYGIQYIYVDAELWAPLYKLVHDRTGNFWKYIMVTMVGLESQDKKSKLLVAVDHLILDPRRDHATYLKITNPDSEFVFFADLDVNDFSLAGFQKYCK